jgi:predicted nucleotidyltransferase
MSVKLANNFAEFLKTFNTCDVDYLIVGGYAVIFYGYGRTTGDLDVWIKPVQENKAPLVSAFKKLELNARLIAYTKDRDFAKPFAMKLGDEPLQVDVFNAITGVEYSEAEKNSAKYSFSDELEVRFIHFDDLITNKMLTGRLKDKADVDELQRIKKYDNRE